MMTRPCSVERSWSWTSLATGASSASSPRQRPGTPMGLWLNCSLLAPRNSCSPFLQDSLSRNRRLAELFFSFAMRPHAILAEDLCRRNAVFSRFQSSFDERFSRYSTTMRSRVQTTPAPRSGGGRGASKVHSDASAPEVRMRTLSLLSLVETLSIIEVRTAFTRYLERVRLRMFEEGSSSLNLIDLGGVLTIYRKSATQRRSSG